jgi:hypothetical protein
MHANSVFMPEADVLARRGRAAVEEQAQRAGQREPDAALDASREEVATRDALTSAERQRSLDAWRDR